MTAPLAPRPLPVRTPRPPLVLGPVSSFLVTFVPTALVLAAGFALVRRRLAGEVVRA